MNIERERELKLDVDDHVELGDLSGVVPAASTQRTTRRMLTAVYYDTADLRLARWACTVRNRDDAGWVVKLPVWGGTPVIVRDEVHIDDDGREPPLAAAALVSALTRSAPMAAVATLRTDRVSVHFLRADGSAVAELVDDRVTVDVNGEPNRQFREVEIELGPGAEWEDIERLVDHLRAAGCRSGADVPKLVRGLGARAAGAPDVVVPDVSEWTTGREVVHAAIAKSVAALVHHLPVARLGEEPEGVHQARVAIRRLRSDLRTFRTLIDPRWRERVEPELRWLAAALGQVRDDDVLLATLVEVDAAAPLLETFHRERDAHHAELLAALDDARASRLLDQLVDAAHDPPTAPHADDPAHDLLRPIVRKRWRKLRRAVDALGPNPPDDELHAVRILAKRCRYALEAVTPAFGSAARSRAKAIARVQDVLGAINDAAVITERLGRTGSLTREQAFAAGQVAGQLTVRAYAHLPEWVTAWDRVAEPKGWRWL